MSIAGAYTGLSAIEGVRLQQDEPMSRHTTYRIGGPAALVAHVGSYGALVATLAVLGREGVAWVILGKGSNLLVSDAGWRGCVILLEGEFSRIQVGEGSVTAGAAASLARLVNETCKAGLSGLEPCVGIPGTVGGAVSMNAGTRREWIGSLVRDVVVLRPGKGLHRYQASDIEWGYRRTSLPTSEIILEVTLDLARGNAKDIAAEMDQRLHRRHEVQPLNLPSCGSVFKNPPERSVGLLIESCGLKGAREGGAMISEQHANFIVNTGGATAQDVVTLISRAHAEVLARFGIDLACEVKLLGFEA